ncbi:sodium:solute symporter family protein [Methermicoccus shengliensis]|uniref:Sodium:solute symporter family protein n=1 Tax=Methermicoccus shengliensis TaxID=660064 RepID=A0A832RU04_9EURY|nr:sodium:solute symporter family protein [Methermicoccus shengliensis]KUK04223.1 MAG: Na+/proline symporter [Euryarchaeota archaeon 55_53]KUK29557.1 MAG: Na+/proline symporter [Methanosarcinales archeaon 56_1174]MDI3488286.1 solute:Na+ symporter, family [Methanosarcinales archaeon]MDN5295823.1 solute:Na+ symporter, family [Methanosarcinales archaeon]HIH69277.1 sodium:solute symporter family protein [Methermicoccus shengliensis]
MNGYHLFLMGFAAYILLLVAIGLHFVRRQRDMVDFWIAGRQVGWLNVGFSAAASWLTAGAMLFVTGLFVIRGVGSMWLFVVPNVLALIVIALLTGRIKRLPTITQPELLEMRYSPLLRAPIAVFIAMMMVMFAVADFKGFSYVLSVFYGVPEVYAVLLMAVGVAIYTSLGGFRAVVWTDAIQFVLLALLALVVALFAWNVAPHPIPMATIEEKWWNPLSLGSVSAIIIMLIALLPGWITEQDTWQKVWAARDVKEARRGMLFGALLMGLVFMSLFITAMAFRMLYPVPASEPESERLYLQFILTSTPPWLLPLFALGFAAAAMSCTDTFATSGASCISRDVYQRFMHPDAPMSRMQMINRIVVVGIVACAAIISLFVDSIFDAIVMGTVIGSASVFFPLLGGIYWKRATKWGGFFAMVLGGSTQVALLLLEALMGIPLESINPLLVEHGVLLSLGVSMLSFVGISLATSPTSAINLAPFFEDVARRLSGAQHVLVSEDEYKAFLTMLEEKRLGDVVYMHYSLHLPEPIDWGALVSRLVLKAGWIAPTGEDTVYRLSGDDLLSSIQAVRGRENEIWLSVEYPVHSTRDYRREMFSAIQDIRSTLGMRGKGVE